MPREHYEPTFTEDDLMSFGKYVNVPLAEVPASYLHWLYTEAEQVDERLLNYIRNNLHVLKSEHPDGIWTRKF